VCVAVCCSVLQCVAVCCSVLQCVLQCVIVCCSVLQCAATHCNTGSWRWFDYITQTACCSTLQHTATHCNTLQHNATQNVVGFQYQRKIPWVIVCELATNYRALWREIAQQDRDASDHVALKKKNPRRSAQRVSILLCLFYFLQKKIIIRQYSADSDLKKIAKI